MNDKNQPYKLFSVKRYLKWSLYGTLMGLLGVFKHSAECHNKLGHSEIQWILITGCYMFGFAVLFVIALLAFDILLWRQEWTKKTSFFIVEDKVNFKRWAKEIIAKK